MTTKNKIEQLRAQIEVTSGMIERYKQKLDNISAHSFSTSLDSVPSEAWQGYTEKIRDYSFDLERLKKKLAELEAE